MGFPGDSAFRNQSDIAGDVDLIVVLRRSSGGEKWQPIPVFLPGETHGQRSLAVYGPEGLTELDMTEATQLRVAKL